VEGSIGGWFAGEEREAQFGAGGETAEVQLPFGRPTAAAQVQHTDTFDRVADRTQIKLRRGRTLFAMDAQRFGGRDHDDKPGALATRDGGSVLFEDTGLDLPCFGKDAAQGERESGSVGESQGQAARTAQLGAFDKKEDVFLAVEDAIGERDELHGHGFKVHGISSELVGTRAGVYILLFTTRSE